MAPPLSVATATATTGGTSAAATAAARPPRLIAVHAGAGLHGVREERRVCAAMRAALAAGAATGGDAATVAAAAVAALEASGVTNAGPTGGALTWAGTPEVDACVVTPSAYGAVGAVAGLASAVSAAAAVAEAQGFSWQSMDERARNSCGREGERGQLRRESAREMYGRGGADSLDGYWGCAAAAVCSAVPCSFSWRVTP